MFSLDVQGQARLHQDSLPVLYPRIRLRSIRVFGRLFLPLPSWSLISLLNSLEPLHGHLPSPGVLLLLIIARLLRPQPHCDCSLALFSSNVAWIKRSFICLVSVDCVAGSTISVRGCYHITSDV